MDSLSAIAWLFPVLFMIHDFEEIIITDAWRRRYKKERESSKMKKTPFSDFISTDSFSCAVAEEFIIFALATFFSCYFDNYIAWYGLFFGIVFHFIIHFMLSIQFRRYVPGLITSLLFLPIGIYILYLVAVMARFNWQTLCFSSIVGFGAMVANVVFLHKMMGVFHDWLEKFAKKGSEL